MTKILLIGFNPPQLVANQKIEAAHYRTWQFLQPLLDEGHEICLCAGYRSEEGNEATSTNIWTKDLTYRSIPFGQQNWITKLQQAHDTFNPDCVVAVNLSHCLYATKLRTQVPVWMDIYGDPLTIMQAAYYRAQSDRGLPTSIAFMRQVLQFGDAFSTCGTPQKHALVGELAMVGRLNRYTFGYEFAHVILPGTMPSSSSASVQKRPRTFLSQYGIHDNDFVVLWCGGYNTWTDVDTLFRALEKAMSQNATIQYVSVGANTYDAPDNVYARLLQMIEQSKFRDRFHMLGWQPWRDIPKYYAESDLGINIDALHYETLYGTRTRLVEMIAAGLPVITSTGAELSYFLRDRGAALTFEIGDWEDLGCKISMLSIKPEKCSELANAAYEVAESELSFATTTTPVRTWVRNPQLAPDKTFRTQRERLQNLGHTGRAVVRQILWKLTGSDK